MLSTCIPFVVFLMTSHYQNLIKTSSMGAVRLLQKTQDSLHGAKYSRHRLESHTLHLQISLSDEKLQATNERIYGFPDVQPCPSDECCMPQPLGAQLREAADLLSCLKYNKTTKEGRLSIKQSFSPDRQKANDKQELADWLGYAPYENVIEWNFAHFLHQSHDILCFMEAQAPNTRGARTFPVMPLKRGL